MGEQFYLYEDGVLAGNYARLPVDRILPLLDGFSFDFIDGHPVPYLQCQSLQKQLVCSGI